MSEHEHFRQAYSGGSAPWDIGRPQAALVEADQRGWVRGAVLDAGCGTGEHALYFAAAGHDVVGVDVVPAAIERAAAKAAARDLPHPPRFVAVDILRQPETLADGGFGTVIDMGFFHTLSDDERDVWRRVLAGALQTGGRYVMVCFSDLVPGSCGPRRITEAEIRATFDPEHGFRVLDLERTGIESVREGAVTTIPGWLADIERMAAALSVLVAAPDRHDRDVGRFGRWADSYNQSRLSARLRPVQEATLDEAERRAAPPREPRRRLRHRSAARSGGGPVSPSGADRRRPGRGDDRRGAGIGGSRRWRPFRVTPPPRRCHSSRPRSISCEDDVVPPRADRRPRCASWPGDIAGWPLRADRAFPVGWLRLVFARAGHGRFNRPATLLAMLREAGLPSRATRRYRASAAPPGRARASSRVGRAEHDGEVHAMTAGGLSPTRLMRLHDVLTGHIERGSVPGLVAVISRRGESHVEVLGSSDPGGGARLRATPSFASRRSPSR